jgi:hypothetical protein
MTEHLAITRAKEAQTILDSEAFKLAIRGFHQEFQEAILRIPDERKYDDDLRRAQMMLKMARKFESMFVGMVQNGRLAEQNVVKSLRDEPVSRTFFRKVVG